MTTHSRQLLTQSTPDIESLVPQDLANAMAQEIDRVALFGNPALTPEERRGILHYPNIHRVTFGGQPLYEAYVNFIAAIASDNVPIRNGAWISTPASWGNGISTPRFPNTGIPLISDNNTLLGYPFLQTNQIPSGTAPNHDICFFGSFSELLIGLWDGSADVVVDPYTLSNSAQVRVVMNQFSDINCRYEQAFCLSTDAAAYSLEARPTNSKN